MSTCSASPRARRRCGTPATRSPGSRTAASASSGPPPATWGCVPTVTARLPDGGLAGASGTALDAVLRQVELHGTGHLVTLWRGDPHPDHRAAAHAALRAGVTLGLPVHETLLWTPHWTPPEEVLDDVTPLALDEPDRAARARALASYTSQTAPLVPGLGPVLPPDVVAWPHEVLVG